VEVWRNGSNRLVAVGDLACLNVGRRGHLSFKDGRVERPLHIRLLPFNTAPTQSGLASLIVSHRPIECSSLIDRSASSRQ
jgi:hypothetical protein